MPKYLSTILAAGALITFALPASAQKIPADPGAAANVKQSEQYEQALHGNSSFRAKRMKEECGPINDPELHQQCMDSFGGAGMSRRAGKSQQ